AGPQRDRPGKGIMHRTSHRSMEALQQGEIDSSTVGVGTQSPAPPTTPASVGAFRRTCISRTIVHTGRKIQGAVEGVVRPDGAVVKRDVVLPPGAVAILPLLDAEPVVLLQNNRPVVGAVLWEVPAGTLEPGEPIEQAAARELTEETGWRAARWRKLGEFFPSPGVLSEKMHLFLAEDLTPGEANPEPGEQLEPHLIARDQA